MALEPITRQEKIIAGQDLTPITRMEMFLKQFGGGGGGGSSDAVLYTAQTLTDAQKKQARKNIEAADSVLPTITGGVSLCPVHITDSNDAVHFATTRASADDYTLTLDGGPELQPVRVKGIRTPTDTETNAAANVAYILSKGYLTLDTLPKYGGETA